MPRPLEPSPGERAVALEETARCALTAARGGGAVVEVLVVAASAGAEGEGAMGRRMLVWDAHTVGSLGDRRLDAEAAMLAREALGSDLRPRVREVALDDADYTLYLEAHRPPPELVIVGAGHIARPLCHLGAMLGYRVTVLDDRPEFATRERFPEAERVLRAGFQDPLHAVSLGPATHLVLVTRGHRYDYEVLREVLRRPEEMAYVGMVGSQRRVRAALQELANEGIDRERLLRVHAPIGLDIGAETPEEIALAIAAEMVRVRRGGTGASLRDRARVVERWVGNGNDQ